MAQVGSRAMSDLSPKCAAKRTSAALTSTTATKPQRMGTSSRLPSGPTIASIVVVGGTRYNTTVPFQAGCRLPTAGQPGGEGTYDSGSR
jgi:hypothetical protein